MLLTASMWIILFDIHNIPTQAERGIISPICQMRSLKHKTERLPPDHTDCD